MKTLDRTVGRDCAKDLNTTNVSGWYFYYPSIAKATVRFAVCLDFELLTVIRNS